MESKYPIMERYKPDLSQYSVDESIIRQFFSDTLTISKCKWEDLVAELEHLKNANSRNFDHIQDVYECLSLQRTFVTSPQEIKYEVIENNPICPR